MSAGNWPPGGGPGGRMGPGGRPGSPGGGQRGGPPGGGRPVEAFPAPEPAELQQIVEEGDAETLVRVAERVGRALAQTESFQDRLTTSQIRSVFGAVREIEMSWPLNPDAGPAEAERSRQCYRQLLLLRPKLAYQARRGSGRGVERLRAALDPAIGLVKEDRQRFQHFAEFFEAILAYHRAFGGQ